MSLLRCTVYFLAFLAVALVAMPLSLAACGLAHAADWLDDLCGELLEGAGR